MSSRPYQEDGPGVVQLVQKRLGIVHIDDEVLRRVTVAEQARLRHVLHYNGVRVPQRRGVGLEQCIIFSEGPLPTQLEEVKEEVEEKTVGGGGAAGKEVEHAEGDEG